MENKRNLNTAIVIISAILSIACIIWLFFTFLTQTLDAAHNIEIVTDIISTMIALAYLVAGYSKGEAESYRNCIIVAAINALAIVIISIIDMKSPISLIACILAFIILVVLSFVKNLGKTISYSICASLILIRLINIIFIITDSKATTNNPQLPLVFAQVCLALTIAVVTYAKYKDKESRNTN